MRTISILWITVFTSICFCNFSFSQNAESENKDYKLGVGLYIGEGSGIALLKPISNQFMIQWNIGINELFVDYNFLNKYKPYLRDLSYDNIFNSSLGLTFHKPITSESPISYRISLGGQLRIIPKFGYQEFIENLPPNIFFTNDPVEKTELDFGIDYYVGISYRLNNRWSLVTNVGGYTELTHSSLWSNSQFRIGVNYLLKGAEHGNSDID